MSLVASILSICYPLFLESIRKIDDQYESTVLAKQFQKECVFKIYSILLFLVIAVSFCTPFVMLLYNSFVVNIIVETLHCVCVLVLVIVMLVMFRVIQKYYNPDALSQHLFDVEKSKDLPNDLLLCSLDLMRYTSKRQNYEVYNRGKEYLVNAATSEQISVKYKEYNFSDKINEALLIATDYATDCRIRPLCNDNILAQVVYNYFCKGYNGEKNFEIIWRCLCKMMDSENTEWFQQYWSAANQYYTFGIDNQPYEIRGNKDCIKYEHRFLELHHLLGALLIRHEKYEWLRYILTVDHVSPPKFMLIPSTFQEIMKVIENVEEQRIACWKLTSKYQMKGLFCDVNSDEKIVLLVYRYMALLLVRLFSYNDYNIRYCDPIELPSIREYSKLTELKEEKRILGSLRHEVVSFWYKDDRLNEVNLPIVPKQESVTNLIDDVINAINKEIQFRIDNPKLDLEKMEQLKEELVQIDNRISCSVEIENEDMDDYEKPIIVPIFIENKLDADLCSKDGYRGWSNFPDVILSLLNNKIKQYLDGRYSLMEPLADLSICEKNLFKALRGLEIPDGYKILAMGVYLGIIDQKYNANPELNYDSGSCKYGTIPLEEYNSAMSAIFVIKDSDMLKWKTITNENSSFHQKNMLELKGSDNHLYTNIDKIITDQNTNPILMIGKVVNLYEKKKTSFIRIRVKFDGDDTIELSKMRRLRDYIL